MKSEEVKNAVLGVNRRSKIAQASLLALCALAGVTVSTHVSAGAGWGDSNGPDGSPIRVQTFYAHSPTGQRASIPLDNAGQPAAGNNGGWTGAALRKFVDPLPLFGKPQFLADGVTSKYIPQAIPEAWVRPDGTVTTDEYYEIALVQYSEKMHSDLKKPTLLRGYVQLMTPGLAAKGVQGKKFTTDDGKVLDVVDFPHYLGPVIVATKGIPTRLKFTNLLPAGRFDAATGQRNGDLFIPVDKTLPGAGIGPDGLTEYTQNRALLHLHGGDTPWISDGTPHQWIAPAAEAPLLAQVGADLTTYMKGPSAQNVPDMPDPGPGSMTYYFPNRQSGRLMWYHDHTYGLTRLNVYVGEAAPYVLQDPQQDAILNPNTVAGFPGPNETIPLVIQDKTFVPDDIALQDARWNMANDASGNPTIPKPVWGQPGDLWYPHVYEINQDPNNGADGTNPVGRWDWGPYFWPVFPALYNVPSGAVDDVTITPEAWMDTPVVNGVAYPTLEVDPKPYRFRILNASNDRAFNLSMFVADSAVSTISMLQGGAGYDAASTTVTLVNKPNSSGSGATAEAVVTNGVVTAIKVTNAGTGYTKAPNIFITDKNGNKTASAVASIAVNTEVKMVPAVVQSASGLPSCAQDANGVDVAPPYAPPCWPSNWPTDGRDGGVPDPASSGPMFYQIGNEGGLLPQVAEIPATPMGYEYNRRSVTVLNTYTNGLFLTNAERADAVVDFSNFAGQTLIVYNDSPAPVPAFDPRNDHWTGKPDESGVGSVETPRAGFGPNTRTIMQIKVRDTTPTALDVTALKAKVTEAYGTTQERPVVGQATYNNAFGAAWSDAPQADGTKAFANIFTGTLQEPAFKFQPGEAGSFSSIKVLAGGSGYITPPSVSISAPNDPNGVQATAKATLKISEVKVTSPGSGYIIAPAVTFTSTVGGNGATGVTTLKAVGATMTNRGSGYDVNNPPLVTFSAPTNPTPAQGGRVATGVAVVGRAGQITGISITDPGYGYAGAPTISIAPPNGAGVRAMAVSSAGVDTVRLTSSNPLKPELAGGGGYTDMNQVTVTISPPPSGTTATATVTGSVFDVTMVNQGSGYTAAPTITISAPTARPAAGQTYTTATANATAGGSILVKNKAIQELFDPTYGRMNATLGIELPFTSALAQTTVPLGYVDPVSEEFSDGETQLWKITHNGVDAHPVHFHLLNVQLVNRIGWDGTVKPPAANEYGWKETIRMNPLEDILVAVRAKKPQLGGFGLPLSVRPRDPSQPLGTPSGFTQIDPITGSPAVIVNQVDNYGWEYVWHCHILGHEENDFMRPVKFNANEAMPAAPQNLVASAIDANGKVALTWADVATTEYKYQVNRAPVLSSGAGAYTPVATLLANTQSFSDTPPVLPAGAYTWAYQVVAYGAAGNQGTSTNVPVVVGQPQSLALTAQSGGRVNVSWIDGSTKESRFLVELSADGGATWTTGATVASTSVAATGQAYSARVSGLMLNTSYLIRVTAQMALGNNQYVSSTPVELPLLYAVPNAPTGLAVTDVVRGTGTGGTGNGVATNRDAVTLIWNDVATPLYGVDASSYTIEWSSNGFTTVAGRQTGIAPGSMTARVLVNRGNGATPNPASYSYRVLAVNAVGQGMSSTVVGPVNTQ